MIPDWLQYVIGLGGGLLSTYFLMVRDVQNIKGQLSILISLSQLSQENAKEIHALRLEAVQLSKDIDHAHDKIREYTN